MTALDFETWVNIRWIMVAGRFFGNNYNNKVTNFDELCVVYQINPELGLEKF